MATPVLATKLYIPSLRPRVVRRPRLVERLNEGAAGKLTLISAPAGFGKTTLLSEWLAQRKDPVAWLALDEGDSDPARFLTYVVAALRTIAPNVGAALLAALQPAQPPTEAMLTTLLNEVATLADSFVLVLDDYYLIDAKAVDGVLTFVVDNLPPALHLVIATREDPALPLARLRARGELTELRAADLRFTPAEAASFLNQLMGLALSADQIAALEARTEGWIAGLQLAAISLRGRPDAAEFIASFTGSHRFVMDYLVEEVIQRQPAAVQTFLLRTSILDRLCGSLCEAVVPVPVGSGQTILENLERANVFVIPLDDERRWYRYHHLFADLLRQRLELDAGTGPDPERCGTAELHRRASVWYEAHGLEVDAFRLAAAANDVARAEVLIEGRGMPLHFRGAIAPVLSWLQALPTAELDAHPSLWIAFASALLATGQTARVEAKVQAAEAALASTADNDQTRDLIGRIAALRASVAVNLNQVDAIIEQSRRALEYLHPHNLAFRTSTAWKLGVAYHLRGERAAARQAYNDVVAVGQSSANAMYLWLATLGLGLLQEADTQLALAAETYRRLLNLLGDHPLPFAADAHLGLARIAYEWNDLAAAQRHAEQSVPLARQIPETDRSVASDVFLARLKLVRGDLAGAAAILAPAERDASQPGFGFRRAEVIAARVVTLIRQGDLTSAAHLARVHQLPLSQARVQLAGGDPAGALATLEPWLRQVEGKGWADERLKALVLQTLALQARGEGDQAVQRLLAVLALAEPAGYVRTFVDEGSAMARLLTKAAVRSHRPAYVEKILAAFDSEKENLSAAEPRVPTPLLAEPLSQRELEVLRLIARGLSNQEIGERLFLALDTVKGHNRKIFGKLQVQRRTEAVARARELGIS
jgi:LuxR family maltose regulon positive regulatory protein